MSREEESLDDLIELANSDPRVALQRVRSELTRDPSAMSVAVLCRARGIAHRVLGELSLSRSSFAQAVEAANTAGDARLRGLALMSDALVVAHEGDIDGSRQILDRARRDLEGLELADLHFQWALIVAMTGGFREAHERFTDALVEFRAHQKTMWVADALFNRAHTATYLGDLRAARTDLDEVARIFGELENPVGLGLVAHNLAEVALISGDAIGAVVKYQQADRMLTEAGYPVHLAYGDHCDALVAVGLFEEAIRLGSQGARTLEADGNMLDAARQRLVVASALKGVGDLDAARSEAERALAAFRSQGQQLRALRSELLIASIELRQSAPPAAIADRAASIGRAFENAEAGEWRGEALLVEADALITDGRLKAAEEILTRHARTTMPFTQEVKRLSLKTTMHRQAGDLGRALRTLRQALRVVSRVQRTIDPVEIRASLSRHIDGIREMGVAILLARGRPRAALELLGEISVLIEGAGRSTRVPDALVQYRALGRAIVEAENGFVDTRPMLARRRVLERDVRRARIETSQGKSDMTMTLPKSASLIRFEVVEDHLVRLDLRAGRVSTQQLASSADVVEAIRQLMMNVRAGFRAFGRSSSGIDACATRLDELLGWPGRFGERTEVLNLNQGGLDTIGFGLLPSLSGRVWTRTAHCSDAPVRPVPSGHVLLVAGPELAWATKEVDTLRSITADARLLTGSQATVAAVLDAAAGAKILHIAAHSRIDRDSPMFSSIRLADGELYIHELEAITSPPGVVVLASCSSAASAAVGSAAIGFAQGLFRSGSHAVVGSACDLPDHEDTVAVMARLHQRPLTHGAAHAVAAVAQDTELTERQRLIASCLVPLSPNSLSYQVG